MTGWKGAETDKRRRAHALGLSAETYAAWYLRLTGWRILKHRYKTRVGEIDLIAKRGKTVAFVESQSSQDPATGAKQLQPRARNALPALQRYSSLNTPRRVFLLCDLTLSLSAHGRCRSGLRAHLEFMNRLAPRQILLPTAYLNQSF